MRKIDRIGSNKIISTNTKIPNSNNFTQQIFGNWNLEFVFCNFTPYGFTGSIKKTISGTPTFKRT